MGHQDAAWTPEPVLTTSVEKPEVFYRARQTSVEKSEVLYRTRQTSVEKPEVFYRATPSSEKFFAPGRRRGRQDAGGTPGARTQPGRQSAFR